MLGQVFLAHFEPIWTGSGPWKPQNSLKMGPFWEQKWVKKGSKKCFFKSDLGPLGVHKQVF